MNENIYNSIVEILDKFENGKERYMIDPTFNVVVNSIVNGCDPFVIIDTLITQNNELHKLHKTHIESYGNHDNIGISITSEDIDLLNMIRNQQHLQD